MGQLQADLEVALVSLGVSEKFLLVGHSFGGALAAEFAAAHPGKVESLVLIATPGEYRLNPLYRLLLRLPAPTLHLLAPYTRSWLGAPPDILKAWYEDSLSHWNGWSCFRSLAVPTLVIRGHLDRVFEKPMFAEVARAIPFAEEVDVGSSGHMVMLERRDAVNRAIHRFMAGGPDSRLRSWREDGSSPEDSERAALLRERPWLDHYDEGVPYTMAIPPVPLHHLLRSAARRFPHSTALLYEGRRIRYARLDEEANRCANALRSLGLEKGDRVMLVMPNIPQLVIAFYGALRAGGVPVFTLPTTDPVMVR
jgi:long-chain acyl-CoA synthetase